MDDADDPVAISPGETLDLHAFAPRDAPSVAVEYLIAARAAGFVEVRLIHGRGRGVQRAAVLTAIARLPWVLEAREAPSDRGGWGATVVVLAPTQDAGTATPG